jgi:hypothetical protein
MANIIIWKKTLALSLAIVLFANPILWAQEEMSDYMQGKIDGERDGKAAGAGAGWFLLGCLGGVMWAYILEPDVPPAAALVGKSSEYVMGYNEGYKKAVRNNRVKMAFYGCITSGVAYCVLYAIAIAGTTTTE